MNNFSLAELEWRYKPFAQLTLLELQAVLQLRQGVFIIEQDCLYPDIDGQDDLAFHLMAWQGQRLVATSRIFPEYKSYGQRCSVGRICSHQSYRNTGIGRELVRRSLQLIDQDYAEKETQIGAQLYLENFYNRFGFKRCSDVYVEDGIEHILMLRKSAASGENPDLFVE